MVVFGSVPIAVCTAAVLHRSCIVVLLISVPIAVFVAATVSAVIFSDRMPVGSHDAMAAEVEGPENYAGELCSGTVHHTWYYLLPSWLIV